MAKTLFYRLFGIGKIPEPLMAQLTAEGLIVFDEGVKASVTYRDFRAPGKRDGWRRQWFTGSIGLTRQRLVALWLANPIINVPLLDKRIRGLRFTQENAERLCVSFDAGLFHADWSGMIEYRFRTEVGPRLLEDLRQRLKEDP